MITLKTVVTILKNDHNFRDILIDGTYFNTEQTDFIFDSLSYDSREVASKTLFFAKGSQFKRAFLADLAIPFTFLRQTMKWAFLRLLSMMSNMP